MLEVLTMQYGSLPQGLLIGIGLLFIVLGGILAAMILPRPALPLSRSWYYLRFVMASFLLASCQLVWLLYVPALKLGVTFVFMLTDVASALAYGAYVAQISRARSRDAYGDDGHAWMAFVPFANLWLIFKPSQTPDPSRASIGAAVAGIVLALLSRGVAAVVEGNTDSITAQVQNDPDVAAIIQSLSLRANGIEAALDDLILAEAAPQQIDTDLLLSTVTRAGSHVTYDFVLDSPDATSLDAAYRRQVTQNLCSGLMLYLQAGATADIRFTRKDGAPIETLYLTLTECTA